MPRHGRRLGLGVVLLIALAVRLHDLDGESIWADEAFSIAMARHSVAEIAARTAAEDTTPPLYYLVLHAWGSFFGDSPAAARMPSVIAGVIAVVFVYLAAVPLIGRPAALVAAAIHALSPFLVAYSQEARQYSLLSCASAASFAALIRLLRGQRWAMPAYLTAAILTLYTHSVGVFVLLAQMLFVAGLPVIAPTAAMASSARRASARARRVPPLGGLHGAAIPWTWWRLLGTHADSVFARRDRLRGTSDRCCSRRCSSFWPYSGVCS